MVEIIDLSREIFDGMPVHKSLPGVRISVHATHEQWNGEDKNSWKTPSVLNISMSEHSGTHVDALSHMAKANAGQTIDTMPLSMFYTDGICLDFRHKGLRELITPAEIERSLAREQLDIKKGDTVLFCTDHARHFGTEPWPDGPGLSTESARWLGERSIAGFGVETMSPGVSGVSNKEVHQICGELGFTHYENMINLDKLLSRGRFRFIAFPLRIRGGTGSPVRAVAIFE